MEEWQVRFPLSSQPDPALVKAKLKAETEWTEAMMERLKMLLSF